MPKGKNNNTMFQELARVAGINIEGKIIRKMVVEVEDIGIPVITVTECIMGKEGNLPASNTIIDELSVKITDDCEELKALVDAVEELLVVCEESSSAMNNNNLSSLADSLDEKKKTVLDSLNL